MALIKHQNRQLHPGPARHFKPQTLRERAGVLRKIDIAEAEMEITLMQREQRAGSMTPDPYRLLEFGMLTRPGDDLSQDEPIPDAPEEGWDGISMTDDDRAYQRTATASILLVYMLAVLASAWLVFGGQP